MLEVKHDRIFIRMRFDMHHRGCSYHQGEIVEVDRKEGQYLIYIGRADRYRKQREGK